MATAVHELGRLDALCNIAGIAMQGHATELATEQWEQDIAAAIAYLASDEARTVNGAALAIDGGQVA